MKHPFLALLGLCSLFTIPAIQALADDKERVLFEPKWTAELGKGWSWVREDSKAWKVDADGLAIRSQPGSLFGGEHTQKNLLLRKPPETKKGWSVEVFLENEPMHQWEHAGLIWYCDDDNFVSVWKEKTGKDNEILMDRKKEGKHAFAQMKFEGKSVWLRLQIAEGKATSYFRATEKDEWKKVGQFDLPVKGEPQVGLGNAGGPADPERWARFSHFRIVESAN